MILADTSIWIDHFRQSDPRLTALLDQAGILLHPFVIGELAMGSLRQRDVVIAELMLQPQATVATMTEVLSFVTRYALFSRGLSFIDAHLLASARLFAGATLWTRDRRLFEAATSLGVAAAL